MGSWEHLEHVEVLEQLVSRDLLVKQVSLEHQDLRE